MYIFIFKKLTPFASKSDIPKVLNFRIPLPLLIWETVAMGAARRRRDDPFQWSSWHSGRIRNQETILLVGPTIPQPPSCVSSLPFRNPRANFSFTADPQRTKTDKWWSLSLARTKDPFDPGGEAPSSVGRVREIHLTTRTLDLPPGSGGFSFISAIRRD